MKTTHVMSLVAATVFALGVAGPALAQTPATPAPTTTHSTSSTPSLPDHCRMGEGATERAAVCFSYRVHNERRLRPRRHAERPRLLDFDTIALFARQGRIAEEQRGKLAGIIAFGKIASHGADLSGVFGLTR